MKKYLIGIALMMFAGCCLAPSEDLKKFEKEVTVKKNSVKEGKK